MATKCIDYANKIIDSSIQDSGEILIADHKTVSVLGLIRQSFRSSVVKELNRDSNFEKRTHKKIWWKQIHLLMRILTEHFEEDYLGEETS